MKKAKVQKKINWTHLFTLKDYHTYNNNIDEVTNGSIFIYTCDLIKKKHDKMM